MDGHLAITFTELIAHDAIRIPAVFVAMGVGFVFLYSWAKKADANKLERQEGDLRLDKSYDGWSVVDNGKRMVEMPFFRHCLHAASDRAVLRPLVSLKTKDRSAWMFRYNEPGALVQGELAYRAIVVSESSLSLATSVVASRSMFSGVKFLDIDSQQNKRWNREKEEHGKLAGILRSWMLAHKRVWRIELHPEYFVVIGYSSEQEKNYKRLATDFQSLLKHLEPFESMSVASAR